jgi:glycosyltransferase involved in cell wall biosynthesis
VAPQAVRDLIWQADAVVGQFALGALGVSELQAMSCAKPVIASSRYPDAYPAPPPVLDATSADEVEAHLERLYQYPQEATTIGQYARDWIQRHHDFDVLAVRLEQLYQAFLGPGAMNVGTH